MEYKTYSEWSAMLDKFGEGDDSIIEELTKSNFSLDSGTAIRFYQIVEGTYKKRKTDWFNKFNRSFQFERLKTVDEFEIALRNNKQNIYPLFRFVNLNGLPEDLKSTLGKDLKDFIEEIRKSLIKNVSKISNYSEKIMMLLNTFDLENLQPADKTEDKYINTMSDKILPLSGRKIIF